MSHVIGVGAHEPPTLLRLVTAFSVVLVGCSDQVTVAGLHLLVTRRRGPVRRRRPYTEAADGMRCAGSLHAVGFLGHDDEAAAHFAQAATIADRWNAPHWAAEARSRTTT